MLTLDLKKILCTTILSPSVYVKYISGENTVSISASLIRFSPFSKENVNEGNKIHTRGNKSSPERAVRTLTILEVGMVWLSL